MAETTKWILSLERGKRMVASCFVVISALSVTCGKLYLDNQKKDDKIHNNDTECAKHTQEIDHAWAIKFSEYQDRKDKEIQDFMKEQLLKAQSIKEASSYIRDKNYALQREAIKNNNQAKSLINNEKR